MFQSIPMLQRFDSSPTYEDREVYNPDYQTIPSMTTSAGDDKEKESESKSGLEPNHLDQIMLRRCLNGCKSMKSLKKQQRKKLPNAIIPIQNNDKTFHEKWKANRDWLDFPHPFRMILASKPNSGKTTVIKNVLIRTALGDDPFEHVIIVHCDPHMTNEYEEIENSTLLDEIPRVQDFQGLCKTLVILEDLNYLSMNIDQKGRLERLFGYASTHKNISCMLTAQDPFQIIPAVRRCTNIFVLWKSHDHSMLQTLASKTGCSATALKDMMNKHLLNPHDSLWIDLTPNSPAPFRLNGYTQIFSCDEK